MTCRSDVNMKTALVTGASRGIGRAIALELAANGWAVAVHYHGHADEAGGVADAIRAQGGVAQTFCADVSDPAQAETLVREVEKQLPPLTALVANAGILKSQFVAFTSPADWSRILATNLSGAFYTTRAVARLLLRHRNGRIVYISSCAALTGEPLLAAYAASKSGLFGLAKSVARELAASGSTANVIAPGPVETDMTSGTSPEARQRLCARIPLGRYAQPVEIARAVRFLLSGEASYITGQVLSVDGGLT